MSNNMPSTPAAAGVVSPNPFAGYTPRQAEQAKGVRVTVRGAYRSVAWGGRVWGVEPETVDAPPALVADLLRAPGDLLIAWPDGFVAPDGRIPASAKLDKQHAASLTSSDRVAIAEEVAAHAQNKVVALERQLAALSSDSDNRFNAIRQEAESNRARALELGEAVGAAEQRAAQAVAAIEAERVAHQKSLDALKAQHAAAIDTLKAQHLAEVEQLTAEVEQLTAKVEQLTADVERLSPAPAAPVAPVSPEPAPTPTPAKPPKPPK